MQANGEQAAQPPQQVQVQGPAAAGGAQQTDAAAAAAAPDPQAAPPGPPPAAAAAPAEQAAPQQQAQQEQQQPQPAAQQAQAVGQEQQAAQQAAAAAPGGTAAAAAGGGGSGDGDSSEPAAKRARAAAPPPDFSYSPEAECDIVLKTSDGKRVGAHRLILLRSCGFFRALLEACEGETEVTVTEPLADIKGHLLDLLYDRAVQLRPAIALKVFHLADKYEAPSLMEACRPVFMSDAFCIHARSTGEVIDALPRPASSALPAGAHADWIDMLALASKHGYEDLFNRCTEILQKKSLEDPSLSVALFVAGNDQIKQLRQEDQYKLTLTFVTSGASIYANLNRELESLKKDNKEVKDEVAQLSKKLDKERAKYMKLLGRHNRLVDKCEKAKVNWHKELKATEQSEAAKKRKKQGN